MSLPGVSLMALVRTGDLGCYHSGFPAEKHELGRCLWSHG